MSEISTYVSSGPTNRPSRLAGQPQRGRGSPSCRSRAGPTRWGRANRAPRRSPHRSRPHARLPESPGRKRPRSRGEWFLAATSPNSTLGHEGASAPRPQQRHHERLRLPGVAAQVEKALADHPDVADVAVAERKVSGDVSVIAAFVVPKARRAPGEAALLAYAASASPSTSARARSCSLTRSPYAERQDRAAAAAGGGLTIISSNSESRLACLGQAPRSLAVRTQTSSTLAPSSARASVSVSPSRVKARTCAPPDQSGRDSLTLWTMRPSSTSYVPK